MLTGMKRPQSPADQSSAEQLAVFNETFASFNHTIKQLNDSYAALQARYQKLSDELTLANERLREALDQNVASRHFLRNVLDSLTSGVLVIDAHGQVTSINPAGARILRVEPEDVIGRAYAQLFAGTMAGRHSLTSLLKRKQPYRMVEKQVRVGEQDLVPIAVSSACLFDANQEIVGALEVFDDLSEIKRMQEEMARVRSLAALGEVATVIAHEVRNPLSGIAGFAGLLKQELGEVHPQISYVNKIIAGVDKLNRSVSSLLEYARDLRHEPQESDLRALVSETADFFRMDLSTRLSRTELSLEIPAGEVVCRFDRTNLSGALINLLRNAEEAMPSGGKVKLRLSEASGRVKISVADQGAGIPQELREKIFTPFFTTREAGTGLGLALVKKVVDAHQGTISVDGNRQRGATFTIELPRR